VALLAIVGLLLKLPLFLYPSAPVAGAEEGILYKVLVNWLNSGGLLFFGGVLSFVLLYIQALTINGIINEYRMTTRHTFLPALSYMLITSLLPQWSFLSAALIATTFILWAFAQLFQLYNRPAANTKIYNIGLLLGLASFFYFPSFLFGVAILSGLLILRPFRLNEILLLLLGIVTPFYFYAVYLFLTNGLSVQKLISTVQIDTPGTRHSLWVAGSSLFLIIPFLIGAYYIQGNLLKMLIQARKNWSIILLWLFFALLIGFANGGGTFTNWIVAAAPFAAFHACAYFFQPRKWVASFLFFAMVAFILVQQYVTNAWQ